MEIKCVYEDVDLEFFTIDPEAVYTCKVTSCNITDRGSAIAAFKGKHETGKSNKSVKALWFEGTKVYYIPRNLAQIFPNLVYLDILNCELKEVSAEDLIGLEKLKRLDLWDNEITTLPVDLFKNMKNLKEASFNNNLIQSLDAKILEPIKNTIKYFGIRCNSGVDEVFNKNAEIDGFIERLELLESKKIDSQRLGNLFSSGNYSDFTIKVQDKEFRVHKGILASVSSVFDKMFSDDAGATSKTFDNITNYSEEAIEEFLRYFYTKKTPSEENITELLKLAVEFDVTDLKRQCEAILVENIKPESARQLFNLAVQKSLPKLKRKAFEAIQECNPEIEDYIYDKPQIVNLLIDAKDEFQAKKIKLEKQQ